MLTIPKRFLSAFLCALLIIMLAACGKAEEVTLDCPFTDLGWDSTIEDVTDTEGADFSTYDSVYGGLCYTYPKEYNGYMGTIKYMFNDSGKLMSVAWAYSAKDTDELAALYDTLNASVNEVHGESGYNANGVGNYGNVWYLETGDIIITTMITSENIALQYAYLHPLVSNTKSAAGQTSGQDSEMK